jgi:hypothetical protein
MEGSHDNDLLKALEQSQNVPTAAELRMLERCTQIALGTLSGALKAMLEKSTDDFFQLADKAIERPMQDLYLEAMTLARDKSAAMEESFRTHLFDGIQAAIHAQKATRRKQPADDQLDFDQFSLVDPDDLEESIATQEIIAKLKGTCKEELAGLDKRLGVLLHDAEFLRCRNPFDPAVLADAFMAACRDTEAPLKARLLFVTMWDKHMQNAVLSTYHELNQYLIEKGILPKIRREIRRGGSASTAEIAAIAAQAAVEAIQVADADGDVFSAMQQWFSTAAARGTLPQPGLLATPPVAGVGVPGAPAAGVAMARPGSAAGGDPAQATAGTAPMAGAVPLAHNPVVLTQLTQLQHGNAAAQIPALAHLSASAVAPVAVLRDLRETVLGDKLGHADAMTIEVVAMLFDYIFDDKQVPDPIKALLGRLQIPVLKAAMIDQAFFSKKTHPTRRLLNLLAEAATGWDAALGHDAPVYRKVESIVQRILDTFEDDLSIFETMIDEFQGFLNDQEKAADALVQAATPLIMAKEKREIAAEEALEAAESAVRPRASDADIPEAVRVFLCQLWTGALSSAYLAGGADSALWLDAVSTMDDLIWSVRPKATKEDREQLIKVLPTLLRRLNAGMDRAQTEKVAREQFMSQLVKCHAAAVSAGFHPQERTGASMPAQQASAVVLQFPKPAANAQQDVKLEIIKPGPVDGELDVEEITIGGVGWVEEGETDAPAAAAEPLLGEVDEETAREAVAALRPGMLVEFRHHGMEPMQAKLKWISPLKGAYLFCDRQGKRAATMPRDKLEAAFRIGSAKLVDEAPLLDRAVNNVIETLKKAAA